MTVRPAALVEFVSLAVLLINLATVHWPPITSLGGPVHGCAYLAVVVLAFRHPRATTRVRLAALVPGVGGLLAQRLTR